MIPTFSTSAFLSSFLFSIFLLFFYIVSKQAAEALGAIGLERNITMLKNSLLLDPAEEVRETCELALKRIEELKACVDETGSSMIEKSPFLSVDPAAPASSCSSVDKLRFVL